MSDLRMWNSSNLSISFSKSLIMIFVREMGHSWWQFVKGDSLGMGVTLASFQWQGTNCSCNERLNSFVITGAKRWEKSLHIQWGSPSGPCAVRFCRAKNLWTVCTSRAGTRVPGGIGIRWGMEYAQSEGSGVFQNKEGRAHQKNFTRLGHRHSKTEWRREVNDARGDYIFDSVSTNAYPQIVNLAAFDYY